MQPVRRRVGGIGEEYRSFAEFLVAVSKEEELTHTGEPLAKPVYRQREAEQKQFSDAGKPLATSVQQQTAAEEDGLGDDEADEAEL